jgi:SAM-dependent methyltransferase
VQGFLASASFTEMQEPSSAARECPACRGEQWDELYLRQGWNFLRCMTCRLVGIDPMPTDEQLAEHYSSRFESGNYQPEIAAERLPTLRGVFNLVYSGEPGRIFDIGCFDGGLLDIAAEAGWETWGLEYQGSAAEIARRKHPDRIMLGALEDCEPPRRDFDVVTAIGVIEHLRGPASLAAFAAKCLRRGGLLVVQTPDIGSWPARMLGRYWPPIAPPEHIWYFNRINLSRLLYDAGFREARVRQHWKPLRLGYAYEQLRHFGPEIQRLVSPLRHVPGLMDQQLKLYGGEMLLVATRS